MSQQLIQDIYRRLLGAFGPQHWWPGETPGEVIIGAVLTQNAAWVNVEKALENLRQAGALSLSGVMALEPERLARLIRPSGYYNLKARRLMAVAEFFTRGKKREFTPDYWRDQPLSELRPRLLSVYGVGPETADSILLYALEKPVFVVDAYTMRFGRRHGFIGEKDRYEDVRALFEEALGKSVCVYNECHALIVNLGKEYCRPGPRCETCPLNAPRFYQNKS